MVGDECARTTRSAIDGLRMAQPGIELLCPPIVHEPAHTLNQVVWQDPSEETIAERLEPHKVAFLAAARHSLN